MKERVRDLLLKEEVLCCGIVAVEILRGAKNQRDFEVLHETLFSLPQVPLSQDVIERASRWGFELDRKGQVVSTTDLIIASASYPQARLLHLDSDFERIARLFDLEEEKISL